MLGIHANVHGDVNDKNMSPKHIKIVKLELCSDQFPGGNKSTTTTWIDGARAPPKYVIPLSDNTFGGLADFYCWEYSKKIFSGLADFIVGKTPNVHGGFIDILTGFHISMLVGRRDSIILMRSLDSVIFMPSLGFKQLGFSHLVIF